MANETNTGWVRLYRSTLGWEWFDDPLTLQLWVVCLLKANYLPTRWRGVEIERGAFVTSVDSLCAETGQTTRQIRTRLARLQASGEISVRATNYKSIITVCKFDTYQPLENENDKRPTNSYEGLRRVAGKKVAKIDKPNDKPKTHIINSNTDDYSDDTKQNDKQNDNQSTNERQTQLFSSDNSIKIYKEEYKELNPGAVTYYDGCVRVNLSEIKPMIAMPFHPSNVYTIEELNENLMDILDDCEKRALVSLDGAVDFTLKDKVRNGKLYVDQGIIAGCAGGGYENICDAADILRGTSIGPDEFTLSVYPASTPVYMELVRNGAVADLLETGAIVKTAFCGPCFGAGDTPSNNGLSIRHSTRNFPNREGSKLQNGQIASVALMDARSIAATAANKGYLTSAADMDTEYTKPAYHFDKTIYENRVFDSKGVADPSVEIKFGPNIKDWPQMSALPQNMVLKVVSEIHDPVTTTDELIPSGETSSYRSNPLGLAEFTLSRKDPAYVGKAKEVQKAQKAIEEGNCPLEALPELKPVMDTVRKIFPDAGEGNLGVGSTIFAVKPGDGSAREQAASCQKVLGGWANIANEYATKRYRSNLINWGMLPFLIEEGDLPFANGDYLFIPEIRKAVEEKASDITAYVVKGDHLEEFHLKMGELTDDEREIILKGCLINYNRVN